MMKTTTFLFSLFFTLAFSFSITGQNSGIFEAYVITETNGNGNFYNNLVAQGGFNGAFLGNFDCNGSLILRGGQAKTFKNGGHDVFNSTLFYRVYESGSPSGDFNGINLDFFENIGSNGDQLWDNVLTGNSESIDLLNGLAPGSYTVEVYVRSQADTNGDDLIDRDNFWSNFENNYKAYFTINQIDYANLQFPNQATICSGESIIAYGRVFEEGLTNGQNGQAPGISVQFGFSSANSDPANWPVENWADASFNIETGPDFAPFNNDEYQYTFTPSSSGTYYYTFRYSLNGCNYVYGGYSDNGGGFWDGLNNVSGVLTVNEPPTWYLGVDADEDGYIGSVSTLTQCDQPDGYSAEEPLVNDCDDNNPSLNPDSIWSKVIDNDGDGFPSQIIQETSCLQPGEDYVLGPIDSVLDCDDDDATVYPGAPEVCDNVDNNCDGQIDEGLTFVTYYTDNDYDGFGDANSEISLCADPGEGYSTNSLDCNDNDAAINPDAIEVCDGIDNNCDGQIDEGLTFITYYTDADQDGFGDTNSVGESLCADPGVGYSTNNLDCNDNDAAINPDAIEVCDGIDNNCDGQIDEGLTFITYYSDADQDGFGDTNSVGESLCADPGVGYSTNNLDCNDNDAVINPDAIEVCDGVDNNCDGTIDEGFEFTLGDLSLPQDPLALGSSVSGFVSILSGNADTATWDWGDGTSTTATIDNTTISGSHSYLEAGVYEISLTAENCNNTETLNFKYVVIYDPNGGFVTGGGTINSPAGAYTPDPTLTGMANFGFVSKYKKGQTVPTGNTQFQFHAGNLNFNSTEYEWLIIAGDKAMFKGFGSIDGEEGYSFKVSAIDDTPNGQIDKFRIRIWGDNGVIYDNEISSEENGDPTTEITGGSIVVHNPNSNGNNNNNRMISDSKNNNNGDFNIQLKENPFNYNAHIRVVSGESKMNTELMVFDSNSRLIHKNQINGMGEFTFGENFSSGIYIIKVIQGQNVITKRIIKM